VVGEQRKEGENIGNDVLVMEEGQQVAGVGIEMGKWLVLVFRDATKVVVGA